METAWIASGIDIPQPLINPHAITFGKAKSPESMNPKLDGAPKLGMIYCKSETEQASACQKGWEQVKDEIHTIGSCGIDPSPMLTQSLHTTSNIHMLPLLLTQVMHCVGGKHPTS